MDITDPQFAFAFLQIDWIGRLSSGDDAVVVARVSHLSHVAGTGGIATAILVVGIPLLAVRRRGTVPEAHRG